MSPSRDLLQRYSDETGYSVGPLEKVIRLGEFASNVGRHPLCACVGYDRRVGSALVWARSP